MCNWIFKDDFSYTYNKHILYHIPIICLRWTNVDEAIHKYSTGKLTILLLCFDIRIR